MQEPIPIAQTFPAKPSPQVSRNYVSRYRDVLARLGIHGLLQFAVFRLRRRWCIWLSTFRSFRGHIQTLSSKDQAVVDLGPALRLVNGHLVRWIRTDARRLYIEKLLAIHCWADILDLEMFLMGFDAGEQWGIYNSEMGTEVDMEIGNHSSWLTSTDVEEINKRLGYISRDNKTAL
jgi:hypothetical protein